MMFKMISGGRVGRVGGLARWGDEPEDGVVLAKAVLGSIAVIQKEETSDGKEF